MESNTAHEANVYQMSLCASSCDTRERNRDTSLPPCRAQGPAGVGNYKQSFLYCVWDGRVYPGGLGSSEEGCPLRSVRRKNVRVSQGKSGPRRAFQAERLPSAKVITDKCRVHCGWVR